MHAEHEDATQQGLDDRLARALEAFPVVGIIRGCPSQHLLAVAQAAADSGLTAIEITLDSPDPLAGIETVASTLADTIVGAGTVRTADEARSAADAGAAFIVAPDTSEQTLAQCRASGLPALPGAATPTEITRAVDLGAFAVKVFPAAQLGGPGFIKAVMAPLHNPRLVPTGGVDPANAPAFLDAGAFAVGIGGSIFSGEALHAGDARHIARQVRSVRERLT